MDFLTKCKVLGELWLYYREDAKTNDTWTEFFDYSDIALPMSYGISQGFVMAVEDSGIYGYIDESWNLFCELINIDPNGEYDGINDAWNASPNKPLSEVQEEEIDAEVTVKRTRKKATKEAPPI